MKRTASIWLAALALAPCPLAAQPAPAPAGPEAAKPDPEQDRLRQVTVLILTGKQAEALPILDTIIAHKRAELAGESRRIYCARSPAETLAYMAMAAKDGADAVAVGPMLADATFFRGYVLVDLKRADEAQAEFEKAIALSPLNARYLGELAELYKARQDWATALATFQRADDAAALSPEETRPFEQARAWRGIGFALIEMGRLDEAENWFNKALALDPNDARAKNELGYIRQQRARTKVPTG